MTTEPMQRRARLGIAASIANPMLTAAFWVHWYLYGPENPSAFLWVWLAATPLLTLIAVLARPRTAWRHVVWLNLVPTLLWLLVVAAFLMLAWFMSRYFGA